MVRHRLHWLGQLLSARGMPSILLEHQLELLGRSGRRLTRSWADRVLAAAAEMRRARTAVPPEAIFIACEISCREAARDVPVRRGAGQLLASAVADRALDFGAHDEALLQVMCEAVGSNVGWQRACVAAHARARAALEITARRAP